MHFEFYHILYTACAIYVLVMKGEGRRCTVFLASACKVVVCNANKCTALVV